MKLKWAISFDAVAVVRAIRNSIYEDTKNLSAEERVADFRKHGRKPTAQRPGKYTQSVGRED